MAGAGERSIDDDDEGGRVADWQGDGDGATFVECASKWRQNATTIVRRDHCLNSRGRFRSPFLALKARRLGLMDRRFSLDGKIEAPNQWNDHFSDTLCSLFILSSLYSSCVCDFHDVQQKQPRSQRPWRREFLKRELAFIRESTFTSPRLCLWSVSQSTIARVPPKRTPLTSTLSSNTLLPLSRPWSWLKTPTLLFSLSTLSPTSVRSRPLSRIFTTSNAKRSTPLSPHEAWRSLTSGLARILMLLMLRTELVSSKEIN